MHGQSRFGPRETVDNDILMRLKVVNPSMSGNALRKRKCKGTCVLAGLAIISESLSGSTGALARTDKFSYPN